MIFDIFGALVLVFGPRPNKGPLEKHLPNPQDVGQHWENVQTVD